MTRVEKFHQYRKEIANMKVDDFSEKKLTANKINKLSESKSLTYADVMDALNVETSNKAPFGFKFTSYQIMYGIVALTTISLLIVLLILTK